MSEYFLLKKTIRKNILQRRNLFSKTDITYLSKIINERIISSDEYNQSTCIGAYYPIGSEVRTFDIMKDSLNKKKEVGLPAVIDSVNIEFYKLLERSFKDIKFTKGSYGTIENSGSKIKMEKMDFLIVPGIAFDIKGNRIGYGKGYYDRFLSKLPRARFIVGLAFEKQIVQIIPIEKFDRPIDIIFTENRVIYPN